MDGGDYATSKDQFVLLSHSHRSTLWGLLTIALLIGLGVALLTMDDDREYLDVIPMEAPKAAVTPTEPAEDDIALDDLIPSAVLELSPQDALTRNLALPLSRASNPLAPPFVAAWLGADLERSTTCLANAVYYEANGEPIAGQRAVAQVVLNRLRHPRYPKTICDVVYQGSDRPTGCQFSFTCDGSLARAPNPVRWKNAVQVAEAALAGWTSAEAGQATHYHTLYVFPKWAPTLLKTGIVGQHIFYRLPGRFHDYSAFRAATPPAEVAPPMILAPTIPDDTGVLMAGAEGGARRAEEQPVAGAVRVGVGGGTPETTVRAEPPAISAVPAAPTVAAAPNPVPAAKAKSEDYFPNRRKSRSHLPLTQ